LFAECLNNVRAKSPLVHNITNYVTVNDVANILLACGGSPIMADAPEEAADITSICNGLNINIGTLNERTVRAMHLAGKKAADLGHPIVLDPVGAGASRYRTETAAGLVDALPLAAIRGNVSELKALALGSTATKGVDAAAADAVTEDNLEEMVCFTKEYARSAQCIVAITGAIDLVADEKICYVIRNGRAEMGRITGTGCQLSGLLTAYLAANPKAPLAAAAAAVCLMGLAGQIGWEHRQPGDGNAAYRSRIIDAVYHMTASRLEEGADYEIR